MSRDCRLTFPIFQIKLVNINASDVVDGRPAVVLGLIWTIILYFQVSIRIHPSSYFPKRLLTKTDNLKSYAVRILLW